MKTATKSNDADSTKTIFPNYPLLATQLTDKGIQHSSEITITSHHQWTSEPLRYSTTAGEYGRYLQLMKTEAETTVTSDITKTCDDYSAENATKRETSSAIIPGWRRFTRLQTQIGMYRSSSFNWLNTVIISGDTQYVISSLAFLSFVAWINFSQQMSWSEHTHHIIHHNKSYSRIVLSVKCCHDRYYAHTNTIRIWTLKTIEIYTRFSHKPFFLSLKA